MMFSVTTIIQPLRLFSLLYHNYYSNPMCLNLILRKKHDLMARLSENSMRFPWESSVNLFTIFVCLKSELHL